MLVSLWDLFVPCLIGWFLLFQVGCGCPSYSAYCDHSAETAFLEIATPAEKALFKGNSFDDTASPCEKATFKVRFYKVKKAKGCFPADTPLCRSWSYSLDKAVAEKKLVCSKPENTGHYPALETSTGQE